MVEPNPKDQPDAAGSGDNPGVSQSDIDALLGAAEEAAAPSGEPQADPAQNQGLRSSSILVGECVRNAKRVGD